MSAPGVAFAQQDARKVALYANVGADLTYYDVDVAGAVVVVAGAVVLVVAMRGLTRSGKSFGAIAAQVHRSAIEITTAAKIRFSISWDRVPTSWIQRMTAGEPSHAEPDSANDAILFHCLRRVDRARRLEPAHRRQQR